MKKRILSLLFAALPLAIWAQLPYLALPNPSFEDWPAKTDSFASLGAPWLNSGDAPGKETGHNNIVKVAGYNSAFGVQMTTVSTATDTILGFVQNGSPFTLKGGVPIAARPALVSFAYKYTPAGSDEGVIFMAFTHQGSLVDSFVMPLPKTTGSGWTVRTVLLSLSQTPDNVIIGAAASNFFLNGGKNKGIPGSVLQLDQIHMEDQNSSTNGLAIDNGAFEYWPAIYYSVPNNWFLLGNKTGVGRTTGIHGSQSFSALQLTTYGVGANAITAGVTTGDSLSPKGRKYTKQIDTLSGYYTFDDGGAGDAASVNVILSKNGNVIWTGSKDLTFSFAVAPFKIYINSPSVPDQIRVEIWSSKSPHPNASDGDVLVIDDLYLGSDHAKPKGIETFKVSAGIQVYPNPATSQIVFKLPAAGSYRLSIYNAMGQKVFEGRDYSSRAVMEVQDWKSGIYFYQINGSEFSSDGKFVKE